MKHFKDNISAKTLTGRALFHLKYSRGKDLAAASTFDKMMCFSHAVRDMAVDGFIATQRQYLDQDVRRVNYLSMEYLIGKMLENNIYALGIEKIAAEALEPLSISLEEVLALDVEAGLGNGGLGASARTQNERTVFRAIRVGVLRAWPCIERGGLFARNPGCSGAGARVEPVFRNA